jgi:hypothetical protein
MKTLIAVIIVVVAYGYVGANDYEDEVKQRDHYCEMVKAGHWPAYDDSINCEEKPNGER